MTAALASCLYEGRVRHRRYAPVAHEFSQRVFLTYLDLDELERVFDGRWLWSTRRPALARFLRREHLGDAAEPLRTVIDRLVHERAGLRLDGPVRLLTHLRYFGYGFNPVSFYFAFDAPGRRVRAIVADVRNTPWGERHAYVLPAGEEGDGPFRYVHAKEFHVSPFLPMEMEYRWAVSKPGAQLTIHLEAHAADAKVFDATLTLTRREITGRALASVLVRYPAMTAQVITNIHAQALRLWWKGVPVVPHPAAGARRAGAPR